MRLKLKKRNMKQKQSTTDELLRELKTLKQIVTVERQKIDQAVKKNAESVENFKTTVVNDLTASCDAKVRNVGVESKKAIEEYRKQLETEYTRTVQDIQNK